MQLSGPAIWGYAEGHVQWHTFLRQHMAPTPTLQPLLDQVAFDSLRAAARSAVQQQGDDGYWDGLFTGGRLRLVRDLEPAAQTSTSGGCLTEWSGA